LPTHPLIVDPQWALCGSSFALGVIVVWTLRRLSRHERR
jgi:hypothetical protein